jgi:hypothetical protein
MLVHARLPDMYLYHALLHACNVFNMLPLKDLVTADGTVTAPFELFVGSKSMVSHFRVFGCPCIAKKWTISVDGKPEDNSKGTQRGIRGEGLEGYILDFPQPKKDCSFMSLLPGRLLFLGMSSVMRHLLPLWLKLGDHSMML